MPIRLRKESEIGRINTLLKRMEGPELCGFYVYAFGFTHASDIPSIPKKLNRAVKLIHHGSSVKGWTKFIPLPKPRAFVFSISDTSRISDLFSLLDLFLHISFVFSFADGTEVIKRLLKSGSLYIDEPYQRPFEILENELVAPYAICTFDLDTPEFESEVSEEFIISDDFFDEIRSVLWI